MFRNSRTDCVVFSQPGCGRDRAYEPQDVVLLAKNNGTEIAKLNGKFNCDQRFVYKKSVWTTWHAQSPQRSNHSVAFKVGIHI